MEQYIKKSDIVAEIERRINALGKVANAPYEFGLFDAYKKVLAFLDSIETKEVDLEKELEKKMGNVGECDRRLAEYFFELGLKAKGE